MSSTAAPATFDSLDLPAPLLEAIARAGYTTPTPIQLAAIPPLREGRDVLGQAATGTGKTAAFALPLLSALKAGEARPFETSALVLVPTRELALQVTEAFKTYGKAAGATVLAMYGGQPFAEQLRPMKRGVDIVVATPGRALDHLKRKTLQLTRVRTVVLDEADEMLDMGFAEDIEMLLSALPAQRQVALFSATMPSRILKLAERQMKNPVRVTIARPEREQGSRGVRQLAYVVPRGQKVDALLRVLELEQPHSALVFCRTRADVDGLASTLDERGLAVSALHGGLSQEQRDRVMRKFKSGTVKYLVATDVAARGIHVDNLSHVINADVPTSPEVYVHRIGRTGRAGREGVAITIAEQSEVRLLRGLERAAGARLIQQPVPTAQQVAARKLGHTQKAVLEAVEAGAGAAFRAWIDGLGDSLPAVAAAAIELVHVSMHREAPVAATGGAPATAPAAPESGRTSTTIRASAPRSSPAARASAPRPRAESNEFPQTSPAARASAPRARADAGEIQPTESRERPRSSPAARASAPRSHRESEPATHTRPPAARSTAPRSRSDSAGFARTTAAERASAPRAPKAFSPRAEAGATSPGKRGEFNQRGPARGPTFRHDPPREGRGRDFEARPGRGIRNDMGGSRGPRGVGPANTFRRQPFDRDNREDSRGRTPGRNRDGGEVVTLFVAAGARAGVRPGDLVGAIANEAGLSSKNIGPIEIRDAFSLVGVPADKADAVINAMRGSTLRGKKVAVRRGTS